jgi:glycosyltransferase involved in cell wall biosynthesis
VERGPFADTWVVVPVFDEEPVVGAVVAGLRETFPNVVCVDDGSRDASAAEAAAAGARVVRHPVNLGAGAALQTGIEFALLDPGTRHLVTFDADGQHQVADAVRMVELLRTGAYDIVLGSRFLGSAYPSPRTGMTRGRRALLRTAAAVTRVTAGIPVTDAHNGLRAMTRGFAERLEITLPGMAHASESTAAVGRLGVRWVEVPVTIEYTDYSRGKGQRSINSVNIAFDLSVHQLFGSRR